MMANATYRMEDIGGPDLTSAATLLNAAYKNLAERFGNVMDNPGEFADTAKKNNTDMMSMYVNALSADQLANPILVHKNMQDMLGADKFGYNKGALSTLIDARPQELYKKQIDQNKYLTDQITTRNTVENAQTQRAVDALAPAYTEMQLEQNPQRKEALGAIYNGLLSKYMPQDPVLAGRVNLGLDKTYGTDLNQNISNYKALDNYGQSLIDSEVNKATTQRMDLYQLMNRNGLLGDNLSPEQIKQKGEIQSLIDRIPDMYPSVKTPYGLALYNTSFNTKKNDYLATVDKAKMRGLEIQGAVQEVAGQSLKNKGTALNNEGIVLDNDGKVISNAAALNAPQQAKIKTNREYLVKNNLPADLINDDGTPNPLAISSTAALLADKAYADDPNSKDEGGKKYSTMNDYVIDSFMPNIAKSPKWSNDVMFNDKKRLAESSVAFLNSPYDQMGNKLDVSENVKIRVLKKILASPNDIFKAAATNNGRVEKTLPSLIAQAQKEEENARAKAKKRGNTDVFIHLNNIGIDPKTAAQLIGVSDVNSLDIDSIPNAAKQALIKDAKNPKVTSVDNPLKMKNPPKAAAKTASQVNLSSHPLISRPASKPGSDIPLTKEEQEKKVLDYVRSLTSAR